MQPNRKPPKSIGTNYNNYSQKLFVVAVAMQRERAIEQTRQDRGVATRLWRRLISYFGKLEAAHGVAVEGNRLLLLFRLSEKSDFTKRSRALLCPLNVDL
jgi:hypothetical protein